MSGTEIRCDPYAHREYLDPHVYASFLKRIGILGGESSGKNTLALAAREECLAQRAYR